MGGGGGTVRDFSSLSLLKLVAVFVQNANPLTYTTGIDFWWVIGARLTRTTMDMPGCPRHAYVSHLSRDNHGVSALPVQKLTLAAEVLRSNQPTHCSLQLSQVAFDIVYVNAGLSGIAIKCQSCPCYNSGHLGHPGLSLVCSMGTTNSDSKPMDVYRTCITGSFIHLTHLTQ